MISTEGYIFSITLISYWLQIIYIYVIDEDTIRMLVTAVTKLLSVQQQLRVDMLLGVAIETSKLSTKRTRHQGEVNKLRLNITIGARLPIKY